MKLVKHPDKINIGLKKMTYGATFKYSEGVSNYSFYREYKIVNGYKRAFNKLINTRIGGRFIFDKVSVVVKDETNQTILTRKIIPMFRENQTAEVTIKGN